MEDLLTIATEENVNNINSSTSSIITTLHDCTAEKELELVDAAPPLKQKKKSRKRRRSVSKEGGHKKSKHALQLEIDALKAKIKNIDNTSVDVVEGTFVDVGDIPIENIDDLQEPIKFTTSDGAPLFSIDPTPLYPEGNIYQKRHYWIQMSAATLSNPTFTSFCAERAVSCVRNVNDWCDASATAQFIIVRTYSRNFRKYMNLTRLLQLTSSTGRTPILKIKGGSANFKPRKDAQYIFIAQKPIFALYGDHDAGSRVRTMRRATINRLNELIHNINYSELEKLGSLEEETLEHTSLVDLTKEELNILINRVFENKGRYCSGTRVPKSMKLLDQKAPPNLTTEESVKWLQRATLITDTIRFLIRAMSLYRARSGLVTYEDLIATQLPSIKDRFKKIDYNHILKFCFTAGTLWKIKTGCAYTKGIFRLMKKEWGGGANKSTSIKTPSTPPKEAPLEVITAENEAEFVKEVPNLGNEDDVCSSISETESGVMSEELPLLSDGEE